MTGKNIQKMQKSAEASAAFIGTMANPVRLMILCHVLYAEKSVSEIEKEIGISQSALSQHLARLRKANLVKTRREGTKILYSIYDYDVAGILEVLYKKYCAKN